MERQRSTSQTKGGGSTRLGLVRLPLELLELALQELEHQEKEDFLPQAQKTLASLGARLSMLAESRGVWATDEKDFNPAPIEVEVCNAPAEVVTSDGRSATAVESGLGTNGDQQHEDAREDDELVEVVTRDGPSATAMEKGMGTNSDRQQEPAEVGNEDDELPVTVHELRSRRNVDLIELFNRLDLDNSGHVGWAELSASLRRAGLTQKEIRAIVTKVDASGDGLIDRDEFLRAQDSPEIQAMFNKMSTRDFSRIGVPKHSYMLAQSSTFRVCWDLACTCALSYMAISEPLFLAFPKIREADVCSGIATAIDVLFLSDVVLNFRTGFYTGDGFEVLDPMMVAKNYTKTWFALDLISSLPFDVLTSDGIANLQPLRLLKYWKVIRVLKLLKMSSALANATQSDSAMDALDSMRRSRAFQYLPLFIVSLATLLICHWLACFMIASGDGFLRDYQDVSGEPLSEYISALYWGFTTITTVGYGDITPGSDGERLYAISAMSMGGAFYGYFIAKFTSIITRCELAQQVYDEKMNEVYSWLEYHQFPKSLRKRTRRYFERYLKMRAHVNDESMLKALSPELRNEVSEHLVSPEVRHHPIMCGLPAGVMPRVAKILDRVEVGAGEIIVRQGEVGSAMYIILTGEVELKAAAVDTNRLRLGRLAIPVASNLGIGDSFGDELFASPGQLYSYTATAQTRVTMDTLHVAAFREEFQDFPHVWHKVNINAASLTESAEKHCVASCKSFEHEALDLLRHLRDSHDQLQAGLRRDCQAHLLRVPPHARDAKKPPDEHDSTCSL